MTTVQRCEWCLGDPLYLEYHDFHWGVPVHDDRLLFEMLILEGAQAGLSWITILRKRENYQAAFDQFDPRIVATYGEAKVAELLQNSGIIRNKLKIRAAITNAQKFLEVQKEFGSFATYIWQFVDNRTIQSHFSNHSDFPAKTEISEQMSKELKKRGFKFVGPTIMYAYMQSCGLVNDHTVDCFRHSSHAEE